MTDKTVREGYCSCGQPVAPGRRWCQEYEDIRNEPDPWIEIEERERAEYERGWD